MNKTKILLSLLTVLIMVVPLAVQVIAYQNNLVGLIIPPELMNLMNPQSSNSGNSGTTLANSPFQPPIATGEPQYFPQNNTVQLTYSFTNPLNSRITITAMQAEMICHDHGFPLGNVSIEPTTLEPKQTLDITATGVFSPEALEHIKTQHSGQSSINAEFENLNVEMAGVKIQMDHQELGYIPIPLSYQWGDK